MDQQNSEGSTAEPESYDQALANSLTGLDRNQAIEVGKTDLNFLASVLMGEDMMFGFPPLFIAVWQFLLSKVHLIRDFGKLAIGIPRGFSKTTLIKIFVCYVILYTNKRFIAIIAATEDHAVNIIKDSLELLGNPSIQQLFGPWNLNIETDTKPFKIFSFRGRKIMIKGIGTTGSIRGTNSGMARPDIMIFDDFQSKEESENIDLSLDLYKKMIGTHMKSKSPFGCLTIFVANMYPTQGSILKKLKKNPDWLSFILPGINKNPQTGKLESLYEDLQPIEQLLDEYQADVNAGHPEIFQSEVLNDENAGSKAGIDISKLPENKYEGELPEGQAIVIDPALDNPNSDYNGIGRIGSYSGTPVLMEVELGKFDPKTLIIKALEMAIQHNIRVICVENAGYQASLLFWFDDVQAQLQLQDSGIHFLPINPGGNSKNGAIRGALNAWLAGTQLVADKARPFVIDEVYKWQPMKRNNSDTALDLLRYAPKVLEEYGPLMLMPYEPARQVIESVKVRSELANSPI